MDRLSHAVKYARQRLIADPDRTACVYVIKCDKFYKIGVADNVKVRLAALQHCNPIELRVVAARRVAKAFSVESKLHIKYKPFHVRGEWFELTEHALHELILLLRGEPVPKD